MFVLLVNDNTQFVLVFRYFQTLAVNTLTELYEMNRQEAYLSLVAMLPFDLGRYVTPITIARDASAMRFMSHACCQTYINLVWMKNMDLGTPYWLVRRERFLLGGMDTGKG